MVPLRPLLLGQTQPIGFTWLSGDGGWVFLTLPQLLFLFVPLLPLQVYGVMALSYISLDQY